VQCRRTFADGVPPAAVAPTAAYVAPQKEYSSTYCFNAKKQFQKVLETA